jgi:hypothetical protein
MLFPRIAPQDLCNLSARSLDSESRFAKIQGRESAARADIPRGM